MGEKGRGYRGKGMDPGAALTRLPDVGRRSSLSRRTSRSKCANLSLASSRRHGTGWRRAPLGTPLVEIASSAPCLALPSASQTHFLSHAH